jgi:tRNA A-37 threonylcarbamoyl transferase component Bud32
MAQYIKLPKTCSLIENGNVSLLVKNEFKEKLLKQGISNPKELIDNPSYISKKDFKGRGPLTSILIQNSNGERMVAKRCMRGGLLRFLNKDIFLGGNRPFNEMIANTKIMGKGIMTAEIIAAVKHKVFGPVYRAYIFSKELPECIDLISYFDGLKQKSSKQRFKAKKHLFQAIASEFVKMHSEGIYHSDLHIKNILIKQKDSAKPQIYIIDFDKTDIKDTLTPKQKAKNLLRFNRSIEKYRLKGGTITRTDQLRFFKEYFKLDIDVSNIYRINSGRYLTLLKLRILKWRFLNFTSKMLKN